ncbi:UPF0193 protein EVG1 homolog [Pararge aegeria]|uniref:Jg16153 protein n=1 Tax=Pararge aegeria aegeria TaxID=348720 RepID=A0A8S4RCX0_9NEOP|nr:UPF0193 protein EVG1 homolog [Pararge aegeria]CAH2235163.1 jg16153 [Pararge aegeria aegeria]
METPDANGFVNITWPSKSVPHGGIFHPRLVEPSTAQREFLKVLLEESKLTIAQRRKSAFQLREEKCKETPTTTSRVPLIRPGTSHRRSLSAIRESGALDVDHYRPSKRGEDREKLIEQLANRMTYGDAEQKPPAPPKALAKPVPKLPTKKDQWNDLLTQIRERAEWLAEMEVLGHAGPHRELIKDQIAERLRALDALGVDSQCSSARSIASGFSVLSNQRSNCLEKSGKSAHSNDTQASGKKQKSNKKRSATKQRKYEEHVGEYEKLSPLQYSPRRRV